jgi:hypothetical protein
MVMGLWRSFWVTASVAAQLATLTRVIKSVWIPKTNTDRIRGGRRQTTTVHIILSTDTPLLMCGETDTFQTAAEESLFSAPLSGSLSMVLLLF